jgi:hypothetical protein
MTRIVIEALSAEFLRVRNKLDGAEKRLLYANSQVVVEETLILEYRRDLHALKEALHAAGGEVPALGEGEETYSDG